MKNKIPKALSNRIKLANEYIKFAQKHDIWGETYAGGTWLQVIEYTHPITISPKGYKARIRYKNVHDRKATDESFNLAQEWAVSDLRWEITHMIIGAIKKKAKEEGWVLAHKGTQLHALPLRPYLNPKAGRVPMGRGIDSPATKLKIGDRVTYIDPWTGYKSSGKIVKRRKRTDYYDVKNDDDGLVDVSIHIADISKAA